MIAAAWSTITDQSFGATRRTIVLLAASLLPASSALSSDLNAQESKTSSTAATVSPDSATSVRTDTVWITSRRDQSVGIETRISGAALRRLPSLNRDFYDFLQLTPQVAAASARAGMSAGGVNTRFNNFLLDGVTDRGLLGNFAAGTGQGAKAISLEAVKEYQVLLSPFDVRYGDFAGGLVNAVTRSGTKSFEGSVFGFTRSNRLARGTEFVRDAPYDRQQYGFAIGGPFISERAHFFAAVEAQSLSTLARGPYLAGGSRVSTIPVRVEDVTRFADILADYGLVAGSAGRVNVANPLLNAFLRSDLDLIGVRTHIVFWHNYASAKSDAFTREASTSFFTRGSTTFPLSTLKLTAVAIKRVTAAEFFTNLGGGALNELTVAIKTQPNESVPQVRAPLVSVAVPRANAKGSAYLESGSAEAADGVGTQQLSVEVGDDVTRSFGAHTISLGARAEAFRVSGHGQAGSYGSWLFSSLDSLSRGEAEQYRIIRRVGLNPPTRGEQYDVYIGDKFYLSDRLSLTLGLRGDVLLLNGRPRYNAVVDSLYARRTDDSIESLTWSPRLGFAWNLSHDRRSSLRGGIGIFVGRPPVPWLGQRLINDGSGSGTLLCGSRRELGPPPAFTTDYLNQPLICQSGRGLSSDPGGAVNLVKAAVPFARTLRTTLAYDRPVAGDVGAVFEGMFTRSLTDFVFVNLNLADARLFPNQQVTDRHGRVLYGTVNATGQAITHRVYNGFSEVIDLQNQSRNYGYQIVIKLEKPLTHSIGWSAAYAFSRVRDVVTPPSQFSANENWQSGRVISGRQDELNRTISGLEVPHRIIFSGSYTARWRHMTTNFSVYYIGESGLPFTYLASLGPGKGDLNADGSNLNDPVYIPRSAADTSEMRFAGTPAEITAQQLGLDQFIDRTPCIARQRGRIMSRNSCRAPWSNTTSASISHAFPSLHGQHISLQLDVFNILNLMNSKWGEVAVVPSGANMGLLEQVAQTVGPTATSQGIFRFDRSLVAFSTDNVESAFQLQLGARYSF